MAFLSQEWRRTFYTLPIVVLNEEEFLARNEYSTPLTFMRLVDTVLFNKLRSDIHRLELSLNFDSPTITRETQLNWIERALYLGVRELVLNQSLTFTPQLHDSLPSQIFLSNILSKLYLSNFCLSMPDAYFLPNLKTLHLANFYTITSDYVANFLDSTPRLSDLSLMNVYSPQVVDLFSISIPVKALRMHHMRFARRIGVMSYNLEEFIFRDWKVPHFGVDALGFLKTFDFDISMIDGIRTHKVILIIERLAEVVQLTLRGDTFLALVSDKDVLSHLPPTCCSLRYLEVELRQEPVYVKLLSHLMQSHPYLQHLKVSFKGNGSDSETDEHADTIQVLQGCSVTHLEEIRIENFACEEAVFEMIKQLLRSSSRLKKLVLKYGDCIGHSVEFLTPFTERF